MKSNSDKQGKKLECLLHSGSENLDLRFKQKYYRQFFPGQTNGVSKKGKT
jgi:hypothetical protein